MKKSRKKNILYNYDKTCQQVLIKIFTSHLNRTILDSISLLKNSSVIEEDERWLDEDEEIKTFQ